MLLSNETTVGGLVRELNRWLKVKWLHADYNKQLPNARDVLDYFKRLFESAEREYGSVVCKARADFYKEQGKEQPDQCCDFDTLTLLDTYVRGNDLVLFTWLGGEQIPILLFHMDIQHIALEDDACEAVKSVSNDNDAETKLVDIMCSVVRKQDATGVDVIQRWQLASDFYREKHPICPVCGNGNVRIVPNDDWCSSGPGRYVCDYCDWESNGKKYYYKSDLGDKDAFQKEVKYLKKVRDCKDGVQKADDTFKEAAELLTATRDKALKGKVEVYIPQQTLESWSKQLERLAADWKGQKNGR